LANIDQPQQFNDPDECEGVRLYLVPPKLSRFVTGTEVPIDGSFIFFCGV
jgi:hypothetical protein